MDQREVGMPFHGLPEMGVKKPKSLCTHVHGVGWRGGSKRMGDNEITN